MGEGLVKSPVIVFQGTVSVLDSVGIKGRKEEENLSSNEKINRSLLVHPYQQPILYLQRLAQSKLKPRMVRLLDLRKRVNINVPFLEVLKEVPSYLKFLKELLSKKGELETASVASIE